MSVVFDTSRSAQPLYQQVETHLRNLILSGALRAGEQLPSVKELCQEFGGLNHLTVRRAIKNLTEKNLVRSIQGRGSFVAERVTQPQHIAILLPHLDDTVFVQIAKGAQETLEAHGVRSLILDSCGSQHIESEHLRGFGDLPVSGAIIFPIANSSITEQIFGLKAQGFDFVLVDRYLDGIATSCVVSDNYQGGYDSATHLVNRGCCHVAWIGEANSTSARMRLQGFQTALVDADIAFSERLVKTIDVAPSEPASYRVATERAIRQAIDELLQEQPSVDGIMACDDFTALFALAYLKERGIKVPDEIAVIGFDDVPEAAASRPTLTTVRQQLAEVGREAAIMLLQQQRNCKLQMKKKTLPVELIVRESA